MDLLSTSQNEHVGMEFVINNVGLVNVLEEIMTALSIEN